MQRDEVIRKMREAFTSTAIRENTPYVTPTDGQLVWAAKALGVEVEEPFSKPLVVSASGAPFIIHNNDWAWVTERGTGLWVASVYPGYASELVSRYNRAIQGCKEGAR